MFISKLQVQQLMRTRPVKTALANGAAGRACAYLTVEQRGDGTEHWAISRVKPGPMWRAVRRQRSVVPFLLNASCCRSRPLPHFSEYSAKTRAIRDVFSSNCARLVLYLCSEWYMSRFDVSLLVYVISQTSVPCPQYRTMAVTVQCLCGVHLLPRKYRT